MTLSKWVCVKSKTTAENQKGADGETGKRAENIQTGVVVACV